MFVQVEGSEDVLYAGTTSIDTQVVFIIGDGALVSVSDVVSDLMHNAVAMC